MDISRWSMPKSDSLHPLQPKNIEALYSQQKQDQEPTVAQMQNLPAMWETRVSSLDREDPLEKGMITHPSILAWRVSWAEEPGRLHTVHGVAKSQI